MDYTGLFCFFNVLKVFLIMASKYMMKKKEEEEMIGCQKGQNLSHLYSNDHHHREKDVFVV